MYIDKANTRFATMNMKSLLLFMGATLLATAPWARAQSSKWADTANQVAFSLDLERVNPPSASIRALPGVEELAGVEDIFKDAKVKASKDSGASNKVKSWYVLNIPVRVYAMGRNADQEIAPAYYVRELKVTAYLLFKSLSNSRSKGGGNGSSAGYSMVKKEITYADIQMDVREYRENGHSMSKASFNVAVFIPRSTACILTGDFRQPEPRIEKALVGYAVEATVNGEPCSDFTAAKDSRPSAGETRNSKIFENALANRLSNTSWWKTRGRNNLSEPDVDICSIAETPYAPFYGKYYPRVKPLYGSTAPGDSGSGSSLEAPADTTSSSPSSESPTKTKSKKRGTTTPLTPSATEDYDTSL